MKILDRTRQSFCKEEYLSLVGCTTFYPFDDLPRIRVQDSSSNHRTITHPTHPLHTPYTPHRVPLILPTFPSTSSRRTAPYDEPIPEISPHSAAARSSGHLDHLATLAAHDPITNGPVSVTLLTPDSTNQDVNDIAVKLRLTVPTKWVLA